jgi:hypothetical protein
MVVTAGHVMLAQEFAQYVTESTDITSNTSPGVNTNEGVSSSVAFTAFAGVRYKVTYRGATESTVAGDAMTIRLRWKNTASVDLTGTEFAKANVYAEAANHTNAIAQLVGTFNSQAAGTLTVVASIQRGGAPSSGAVKQNGTVSPLYFLVEIIGPA